MNTVQLDSGNSSLVDMKTDSSDQNKKQPLEPPPSSSSFADIFRLVLGRPSNKPTSNPEQAKRYNSSIGQPDGGQPSEQQQQQQQINPTLPPNQPAPKRACRAPLSRKFAHPCSCSQSNIHHKAHPNVNITGSLPPAAYTTILHLYDPVSKKCFPTSRNRDMLLKECRSNVASPLPHQLYHGAPCVYDDLVCDAKRNRCTCRPSLHLYYESNSTFGCVPVGPTSSPDGRVVCRSGSIYNVISKECQKVFDVNELPPSYTTSVSATQFSFVTIVLIWILLLILIVTAKLRKLRTSNLYRNSPASERRLHHGGSQRRTPTGQGASAWLHPFIAAVNGHHHMNHHRTVDSHSQAIDDPGNYNDTDFFLTNGNRRLNGMLSENNFAGSQQSINNPPPKFEEIYPTCLEERATLQPPSNEDLPSYDEAMKLQNTIPPDIAPKE